MAEREEQRARIERLMREFAAEDNRLDAKAGMHLDDSPRRDVGLVDDSPLSDIQRWSVDIRDGRVISLADLHQFGTNAGQLNGYPMPPELRIRAAVKAAERLFPDHRGKLAFLQPPLVTGLDPVGPLASETEIQWFMLPAVTTVARFDSLAPARDPDEVYSSVVVVWFQDEYGLPGSAIVAQLRALDWNSSAEDWTP
ncbi:MAG: hypothetical protein AB7Q97_12435 [Gammaproteobacteria bacterium]